MAIRRSSSGCSMWTVGPVTRISPLRCNSVKSRLTVSRVMPGGFAQRLLTQIEDHSLPLFRLLAMLVSPSESETMRAGRGHSG